VQGRLRNQALFVRVKTECGHCGEPLHLDIDSELNISVHEASARPMVYAPMLNPAKLDDPSIIDGF